MPKHIEELLATNPVLRDSLLRNRLRVWAAVDDFVDKHFPDMPQEAKGLMVGDLLKNMGMIKEDPDGQK